MTDRDAEVVERLLADNLEPAFRRFVGDPCPAATADDELRAAEKVLHDTLELNFEGARIDSVEPDLVVVSELEDALVRPVVDLTAHFRNPVRLPPRLVLARALALGAVENDRAGGARGKHLVLLVLDQVNVAQIVRPRDCLERVVRDVLAADADDLALPKEGEQLVVLVALERVEREVESRRTVDHLVYDRLGGFWFRTFPVVCEVVILALDSMINLDE